MRYALLALWAISLVACSQRDPSPPEVTARPLPNARPEEIEKWKGEAKIGIEALKASQDRRAAEATVFTNSAAQSNAVLQGHSIGVSPGTGLFPLGWKNPSLEVDRVNSAIANMMRTHRVIGEGDDRYSVDQIAQLDIFNSQSDRLLAEAKAVLILVRSDIGEELDDKLTLSLELFRDAYNVCPGERFLEEVAIRPEPCTAFLVDVDDKSTYVVTAGHCLIGDPGSNPTDNARRLRVLQGYWSSAGVASGPRVSQSFESTRVAELVDMQYEPGGEDWALLRLQKPLVNVEPLKLARQNAGMIGERVHAFGYPKGIPLRISIGGAVARRIEDKGRFQATIDVFVGNSGSPIISDKTGEVVGVLSTVYGDYIDVPQEISPTGQMKYCARAISCIDAEACGVNVGEEAVLIDRVRVPAIISALPRRVGAPGIVAQNQ